MDNFKQECKLCDNIITDENEKVIIVAKDMLDILLLKLTLNETQNVMCTMCSSKLLAAFNFKSKCLDINNTIITYVDFKNPKPVDLKQIYAKEKENMQGGRSLDDTDVCRLCLKPTFDDHKSIQEAPVGSIEIYIPEINFEATTNPVICIKCHDALHDHSAFIKNCLDVDRKRNGDAMDGQEIFLKNQSIKTEEIEIKSEEIDEEMLFETSCDIKKEHIEGDTSLQSQTDLTFSQAQANKRDLSNRTSKRRCLTRGLKVQEYQCDKCTFNTKRKSNFVEHQVIHKDPSEVQMYKCEKCKYITRHKRGLKRHQLTHKDPSEVKMFKCYKCTFETKHKNNLKTHYLTHKDPSEVQMFECDECDYKSKQKNSLKQHQLKHKDPSEVQVFQCDECDYKSIQKHLFKHHQLRHINPPEVQTYKCGKCQYKTKHKNNFMQHQSIHEDPSKVQLYKCDKCIFITKHKSSLEQHYLTHKDPSEVEMFKCDKCTYETKLKGNLVKHCSTHKDPAEVRSGQSQDFFCLILMPSLNLTF